MIQTTRGSVWLASTVHAPTAKINEATLNPPLPIVKGVAKLPMASARSMETVIDFFKEQYPPRGLRDLECADGEGAGDG